MSVKRIAILGSTGSIGCNALEVIEHLGADFRAIALSANKQADKLLEQVKRHRPAAVAIADGGDDACCVEIRKLGVHVGITLRPMTRIETLYPLLDLVDVVLIMSVKPGFSGQKFMPEVLPKARDVKKRLRADQRIEIDGGIHAETIAVAREAGVDWFVIGSGIFEKPDRRAAISELRRRMGHNSSS